MSNAGAVRYTRPPLAGYQTDGFFHDSRIGLIEGTTKTGKNHAGMAWLFEHAAIAPRFKNYWWLDPVYPQAAIAYRRLKDAIPTALRHPNDSDLKLTLANDRVIWFKSGEKPDNLYGEDVGAAVINEASRFREEAWWAVRSTLTHTQGMVRIIGNLKGRLNWFYRLCRRAEAGEPDMLYRKFISAQAVAAGFIAASEVEAARRDLPAAIFGELYLGIPSDDGGNPFGLAAIRRRVAPLGPGPAVAYGVDLAKSIDWTVVLGLNAQGAVCDFDRFQAPWRETMDRIRARVRNTPALVDSTGVGDPVLEVMQRVPGAESDLEGYKFTSESKQRLMEGLAVAIQRDEVSYPEGPIVAELEAFEYEPTRTGVRYTAPDGMHDDCVCALALAVAARDPEPQASVLWSRRKRLHYGVGNG